MNPECSWTAITPIENIPLREGRAITVGDREIAIFRLENRCLTVENKCPHRGGPLSDGIISGAAVVCPLHGRRFDLESGMAVRASEPACIATFPTRVENGIIFVNLAAARKAMDETAA